MAGVTLALYATTEANAPVLGTGATDSTGMATFPLPRAPWTSVPAAPATTHLVFAKVTSTGHDDLVVSDNADIEIAYAATDRESQAPTAVRLLNNRANFQWWVKSDEDAEDGDQFLAGWKVVFGTDTIATDADGKGSYSGVVELGDKPATMTVMGGHDPGGLAHHGRGLGAVGRARVHAQPARASGHERGLAERPGSDLHHLRDAATGHRRVPAKRTPKRATPTIGADCPEATTARTPMWPRR